MLRPHPLPPLLLCAALLLDGAVFGSSTGRAAEDDDGEGAAGGVHQAYADVDYARCRERAQAALQKPAALASRLDVYRYLGLCEAALGNADDARDAFSKMLAIDRASKLPDGLSPRFTSSFREAKGAWSGQVPLALTLDGESVAGRTRTIRVKVVDLAGLIARISYRSGSGVLAQPVRTASKLELEVPSAAAVDVLAFDKGGGEVAVLHLPSVSESKPVPSSTVPVVAAAPEPEGFPWLLVTGVGVGAVLVAGAAAATAVVLLMPPQKVGLKSQVVFGSE